MFIAIIMSFILLIMVIALIYLCYSTFYCHSGFKNWDSVKMEWKLVKGLIESNPNKWKINKNTCYYRGSNLEYVHFGPIDTIKAKLYIRFREREEEKKKRNSTYEAIIEGNREDLTKIIEELQDKTTIEEVNKSLEIVKRL